MVSPLSRKIDVILSTKGTISLGGYDMIVMRMCSLCLSVEQSPEKSSVNLGSSG